jgi:DNA ligase D-like protein (predicted 3'-phosphoesterase)
MCVVIVWQSIRRHFSNCGKKKKYITAVILADCGEALSLDEYWRKRDFQKTTEPKGELKLGDERIYVIQKHAATHLHFDLRLEMDGVLKSWAIPKEPPTVHGVKRLAVQVEDHPVGYAGFEGTIPDGEYGAGTVEIWDKGTYGLIDRKENKLIVEINGAKLKGAYVLVRLKDKKNWLFFKKK